MRGGFRARGYGHSSDSPGCARIPNRGLSQEGGRRSRPLVGIHADFGCPRHTMPRHQVIPGRKREEAVREAFVKSASETARQSPKIRISVKWHQARPASSDLFGRCRVRILTFTTLYPNLLQPQHGIFVETRLRKLVASGVVSARVVAPCPWFPFASARFGRYAVFARMPREETRHGLHVEHPRYPVLPRVGMSAAPLALCAAVLPFLRRQIRRWPRLRSDRCPLFLSGRRRRRSARTRSRSPRQCHCSRQRSQRHRTARGAA